MFFGIIADEIAAGRIDSLRQRLVVRHGLRGSPIPRNRLHLSLIKVGDYRHLRERHAYGARLAAVRVSVPPFEVVLDAVETFSSPPGREVRQATVLRSETAELGLLSRQLRDGLWPSDIDRDMEFKAHMTLCYGPVFIPYQQIDPIRFVIREFDLIHSELWLTRYNILGKWPLH